MKGAGKWYGKQMSNMKGAGCDMSSNSAHFLLGTVMASVGPSELPTNIRYAGPFRGTAPITCLKCSMRAVGLGFSGPHPVQHQLVISLLPLL